MKKAIGLTVGLIVFFAVWLYMRLGGYKPVQLSEGLAGPFHLVFRKHTGAYYKIAGEIDIVEAWAKTEGEKCDPSFGEFLDDPNEISEDRLQSHGGCLVEHPYDESKMPEGFHYREQPARLYVQADFDGAPSIGPMKVYPKASAWIRQRGYTNDGPIIELYRVTSPKSVHTEYLFPVKK